MNPENNIAIGKVELKNVSKKFNNSENYAIKNVSLTIQPGEFVVVVGPSGCGKSTLLSMIAGMTLPSEGEITLDNNRVAWPGPDRAVVFQDHALFPWLTARENVEFGLKMKGMSKEKREALAEEALKLVHLPHAGKKLIHELSGGMRQRVAIARALVLEPAVLLMDEPFAALDAQTRTLLHVHLQELWHLKRKTIFFVTHSVGEAVRLANRIIVLRSNPGQIRKEIPVPIPYPRDLDGQEINHIVHLVRSEIAEEVSKQNRKNMGLNET